ncbi:MULTISPECIES: PSP1 domain-containing protein [Maribacter]|uniref:Cell fate regulator YaaT, PSP1 superfamily (Controls sporulation, competence, biofilm development) n=1 Tax=Maribacter stanieri TaxID=440514 RepID=A0A1I6HWL0_9FLAO|nr:MULTISPECIES: regulatory iron-sulfur-containing complex subunit RicT [Maribacter]SFR58809.1 Cell fate regulator YaaT, PSP1 superfamily (controls sporulation, competence, biofilm development) [Maribacter stanieri]|tara:strand:+ start:8046 stop:9233 length:1188 start_codon:yes stop_codon:yes gene_type:complete
MGCSSCSTGKDGQPKGCKNNGTCGTDGCNKLTVFDWLSNMSLPNGERPFDFVEVRFKNSRKEFFQNTENLSLSIGDIVATQAQSGHDIGMVTLTGELVRVQMKRKKESFTVEDAPKVYRKASQKDIDIWQKCRDREEEIKKRAREIAIILKLQMKISDVEFQGDGSKATFYYTADERVDFRQLIKDMAKAFGIRIEMRQIGYRQEAQRLGGIGSCGRELCCSTWLTDFRSVSTSAARYQQLSLNPQKLAGQCGKLKCCLNYELDVYLDALKDFPSQDTKLFTDKGLAFCQKTDIFKEMLWFSYKEDPGNWHVLSKDQVNEILEKNKKKEKVASLEMYAMEIVVEEKVVFENVVGQDSLTRFDKPKGSVNRNKNKNRNRNRNKNKNKNRNKNQKNA